jgi:hypothetical protein
MLDWFVWACAGIGVVGIALGLIFRSTWRAVLTLIAIATVLMFVGGIGWVAARIAENDPVRMVFQVMLVVAIATTFLSLVVAGVVGAYHVYLYLFTDKKPLGLFSSTSKGGSEGEPGVEP